MEASRKGIQLDNYCIASFKFPFVRLLILGSR